MGSRVSLLFLYKDGFGIKYDTKIMTSYDIKHFYLILIFEWF